MTTIVVIAAAYVLLLSMLFLGVYRRRHRKTNDLDALGTVDSHREYYR